MEIQKGNRSRHAVLILRMVPVLLLFLLAFGHGAAAQDETRIYLRKGQTAHLTQAGVTRWKSKNRKVARVAQDGTVTAVKRGTAVIVAKLSDSSRVRYKVYVEDSRFGKSFKALRVGKSTTLKIRNTSRKYKVTSSDPSVVRVKKKGKYACKLVGKKVGTAQIIGKWHGITITCDVSVVQNPEDRTGLQTLYMDGNVFKELTWNRSDTGIAVSDVSSYGQSAPLYIHKDGGDGLENIWAETNNGAVQVPGVKLTEEERKGTIKKACAWAKAVCNSKYHGYDMYAYSPWGEIFGQAKENALGTGDYTCFSIPLCAYYFAGVNTLGENLGGPDAKYIPNTTMLWYTGYVSFWNDGDPLQVFVPPYADWQIWERCGFTNIVKQYKKAEKEQANSFIFEPGDILMYQSHAQMVVKRGTLKTAKVAQAHGYGKDRKHIGGDQGSELTVSGIFRKKDFVWVYRFTGEGVKLNTAGLAE